MMHPNNLHFAFKKILILSSFVFVFVEFFFLEHESQIKLFHYLFLTGFRMKEYHVCLPRHHHHPHPTQQVLFLQLSLSTFPLFWHISIAKCCSLSYHISGGAQFNFINIILSDIPVAQQSLSLYCMLAAHPHSQSAAATCCHIISCVTSYQYEAELDFPQRTCWNQAKPAIKARNLIIPSGYMWILEWELERDRIQAGRQIQSVGVSDWGRDVKSIALNEWMIDWFGKSWSIAAFHYIMYWKLADRWMDGGLDGMVGWKTKRKRAQSIRMWIKNIFATCHIKSIRGCGCTLCTQDNNVNRSSRMKTLILTWELQYKRLQNENI